ncbi:four helix bundle protein [Flavobacterium dauae]|uniref:four helix bundle protein n=1 Tax=Flavobacterium dauae TaxID=1563479 RepID=UPI00101B3E02|nr:four helix bundle protein [Flavobacterium dauae]WLD23029.1 four helix bundle protein [Flavobacterium dauae]
MGYVFSFEKLEVWKNAKNFILDIYELVKKYPKEEIYGLSSQIKRSSSSIATNIAEGTSRNTKKDKAHFLTIAYSSAMEIINHLIISRELNYISEIEYCILREQIEKICNQINSLRKYVLSQND